jgi:hypothetical protein
MLLPKFDQIEVMSIFLSETKSFIILRLKTYVFIYKMLVSVSLVQTGKHQMEKLKKLLVL